VLAPALALALVAGTAIAAGRDVALREAEDEYRQHLLVARPDLATRFGVRGADDRLVPVSEATLGADSTWLAEFSWRLQSLSGWPLKRKERDRLDTLRARVAREREPHMSGAWRSDPSLYLALGPRAVIEAAKLPGSGSCARMNHAIGRMRLLPEVLRAARVTLRPGEDSEGNYAAGPWLVAMDSLRALPARLAGCRDPVREADLVEADSLALAACDRFVRFLAERRPADVRNE
jgi:hypothetical protein